MVSVSRPSLCSMFQTKSYTGNSEIIVMGFGAISSCHILVWK